MNTKRKISASSNMGLQMLSSSNKRTREDCLNGKEDDDSPVPTKMGKTDDSLWEEYYPAGKCYQCNEGSNSFYNTPFACEQYNPASNQCWPAQLPHQGPAPGAVAASPPAPPANLNSNLNQTNSSQCNLHLSSNPHMCNGNAVANPSTLNANHLSVSSASASAAGVVAGFHGSGQQPQQTIRCDENGKSYLDLGSGSSPSAVPASTNSAFSSRCCNPRTKWCMCGPACYRQRRLTVLNISMCKLGRYRQFTDPSLYRSVLICNTLRYIEREMEQEGCFASSQQIAPLIVLEPPPEPPRAPTPYPQTSPQEDSDSGIGDDNRSINWGSVLSLSSQSDLDPLNNNDSLGELDFSQDFEDIIPSCKLTPLSVDDILKTVPTTTTTTTTLTPPVKESPDIDNIMQVLRFTS